MKAINYIFTQIFLKVHLSTIYNKPTNKNDTKLLKLIEWKIICHKNIKQQNKTKQKPSITLLISRNRDFKANTIITHDKVSTRKY